MLSIWEILGLDGPTSDEKLIKRAYAKKLKETRPEEDQDGFMQLRQAFDQAKNIARSRGLEERSDKDDDAITELAAEYMSEIFETAKNDQNDEMPQPVDHAPINIDTQKLFEEQAPGFSEVMTGKIRDILRSPWSRSSEQEWEILFSSEALSHIDAEADFNHILRHELLMTFGYFDNDEAKNNANRKQPLITPQVATYIFQRMDWADLSAFDFNTRHELTFLANDLGVQIYDPEHEEDSHVQALPEGEETQLFYGRITLCILFLIGGLILTYFSLLDGRMGLTTILGIILLLRAVRMWVIIFRDHL